jgi:putative transposase
MPAKLKRKQGALANHRFLDEVFVNIQGQRHYLWRTIDRNRDVIDIVLQRRRNGRAARRFFRKLLEGQQRSPDRLVTGNIGRCHVAHREKMPGVPHDTN